MDTRTERLALPRKNPGRAAVACLATLGLLGLVLASPAATAGPAPARGAAADPSPARVLPAGFDALVGRIMKTFDVPGLGLAVVHDGRVVLARGYGIRKIGDPAPVDARTLFGIASNTKAFTATALGLLVEEGKIEWDGQVTRYLPWFQMWDPYVTREMTVRDLLVHRSGLGLGAGDLLLWPETTYTRREIVGRLRYVRPATSFRSAYAYDNMLYIAAGELIEVVSGMSWEDFVAERILKRAGMASSRPRHSAALAASPDGNVAIPHAVLDGRPVPVAVDENDHMNPAGGIISCAEDMARWMLIHLDGGRLPDGTRLFAEGTERQLTSIVTPMPIAPPAPELAAQRSNFSGYALGFRVSDYRGRRLVNHTGGLSGYVSRVVMVPELGLGIAVLTNQESDEAYNSVIYAVLDQAMGAPAYDWAAAYLKVRERAEAGTDESLAAAEARRDRAAKPSLPLAAYAGPYADAWYGPIDVTLEGSGEAARLVMSFAKSPGLVGDLEHWSRETFVARWRDRGLRADAYVTFVLDADGAVVEARMKPFSPDTDFSFDFQDLLIKPVRR
ncbi:MAG TPA: serine hydrolase [Candidatus Aminicenantes bacterium]|nr:serine hydrolase [Candidatus Aminicenantes bacterium]HRY65724.1 serine hydrolase [Candidatus Aminicenantes bacterium]HRZ72638.1 serine hydrolase [Candidatus Aminicenantes bacterium]